MILRAPSDADEGGQKALPKGGRKKLDELQVLRFVAAMAVVLFHLFRAFQTDFGASENFFQIGAAGVDVFFVLSGFVIAYSAYPERGPGYFMIRRIARIVPLYWTLTIGVALVTISFPYLLNSTTFDLSNLAYSLFFIPYQKENGLVQPMLFLGWTLNYEMFFYAIFAATLWLPQWRPWYPCVVVSSLVVLGFLIPSDSIAFVFYTKPIMLEFCFGILLCMAWRSDPGFVHRYRLPMLAVFLVFLFLSCNIENDTLRPFIQGIGALSLVALALSVTLPKAVWTGALVLFGNASYSLYLSHPYLIQAYSKALANSQSVPLIALGAVLTIAACIALSVALYLTIEVRAQKRILDWWAARTTARIVAG